MNRWIADILILFTLINFNSLQSFKVTSSVIQNRDKVNLVGCHFGRWVSIFYNHFGWWPFFVNTFLFFFNAGALSKTELQHSIERHGRALNGSTKGVSGPACGAVCTLRLLLLLLLLSASRNAALVLLEKTRRSAQGSPGDRSVLGEARIHTAFQQGGKLSPELSLQWPHSCHQGETGSRAPSLPLASAVPVTLSTWADLFNLM